MREGGPLDRAEISRIAHTDHPIAAPVGEARVERLLGRIPSPCESVLDLGCGPGEWLLRALRRFPAARGVGVDIAPSPHAPAAAARLGITDRVTWVRGDATTWAGGQFDAVFSVGASHAFGGLDGALRAVRAHLRPGGSVVLGDGIWEVPPTPAAQRALDASPEDMPDLAGLVARTVGHGFEVLDGHVSTLEEWDDYEWSWTGSLVRWALAHPPGSPEREEALGVARAHRDAWLGGYRRQLGFVTLLLRDVQPSPAG